MQMETQESLSARFAAQQEVQLSLIEKESTDLRDHITYWDAVRKENVIAFYAKKEGYSNLGLQPLATTAVSEHRAKQAIKIQLLLESLIKSPYGNETWTLGEVSAELLNSEPKNCFKKGGFIVTLLIDNDPKNIYPYTCWEYIYYQDVNNDWHKVMGQVDHNGLYFKEHTGDIVYFVVFQPDVLKYGKTGEWTVKFKNKTILAPVTSSSRTFFEPSTSQTTEQPSTSNTTYGPESPRRRQQAREDTESPTSTSSGLRLRRRKRGESPTSSTRVKKSRLGADSAPTPSEVGSRSHSVARYGLSRLGRLQEEARDPPVALLTGHPNNLKCWRNRCNQKYGHLYLCCSSVFRWLGHDCEKTETSKVLVAFKDLTQRQLFLETVTLPKGTEVTLGSLDSL